MCQACGINHFDEDEIDYDDLDEQNLQNLEYEGIRIQTAPLAPKHTKNHADSPEQA